MLRSPVLLLFLIASLAAPLSAAVITQTPGVISVQGIINGSSGTPYSPSDTLDYLTFEVMTASTVTVTLIANGTSQLWIGQYIGRDDKFGFLVNSEGEILDTYTFTRSGVSPESQEYFLLPGIYVVAHGIEDRVEDDNQLYDVNRGYMPVNPSGGGFAFGNYSFSVSGDIRGIDFRDGELNGTFITTPLPEPSSALLLAVGLCAGFSRRRRHPGAAAAP